MGNIINMVLIVSWRDTDEGKRLETLNVWVGMRDVCVWSFWQHT